jgi:hypothetical protein
MTRGYTSTEFYTTLLSYLVSIIALFHIDMPSNTPAYVQAAALLASGVATAIYTHSRQQIKVASIANTPAQTTLIMRPTTTVNPSAATTTATVLPSTQTPNPFVPETNVATPVSTSSDAAKASV